MKNSIIYLGIAMVSFANVNSYAFNNLATDQEMYITFENPIAVLANNPNTITHTPIKEESTKDLSVNLAELIYKEKPIEEVVFSANQIIESNPDLAIKPLNLPFSDEIDIADANQIIESDFLNITYPLDFEFINKNETAILPIENKVLWTD